MKELLEKLKSLDPTTYKRFAETELAEYEYDDENGSMVGYIYQENLIDSAKMAWLQACLQDAISLKGWFFYIQWDTHYGWMASINDQEEPCAGDSPAKSLLAAYIAACEAKT